MRPFAGAVAEQQALLRIGEAFALVEPSVRRANDGLPDRNPRPRRPGITAHAPLTSS